MTTRGVKAAALAMAAMTAFQAAMPVRSAVPVKEVRYLEKLSEAEQTSVIEEAVELLKKRNTLYPDHISSAYFRLQREGKDIYKPGQIEVQDLRQYFWQGGKAGNYIDSFMRGPMHDFEPLARDDLKRDVEAAFRQVEVVAVRLGFEHPSWSFSRLYKTALEEVNVQRIVRSSSLWREYDFNTFNSEVMYADTPAYGLLLFHPDEALKFRRRTLTEATDHLLPESLRSIGGHTVQNNLGNLEQSIVRSSRLRRKIKQRAEGQDFSPTDLATAVGTYHQYLEQIPATPAEQQTKKEQQPFSVGVQLLTLGIMPHLRRMHEQGIQGIITTDRGARPIGKISEHIARQLQLPIIPQTYFKFCGREKLVESYARSINGEVTNEEYDVLRANAALRELEKAYRQSPDPADQQTGRELKEMLASDVVAARAVYDRLAAVPEAVQLERATASLAQFAGKKVVVLDDWINTGATRKNATQVLATLGIDLVEMISIIDTPNNEGAAIYADAGAFMGDGRWRESLFSYKLKGCTGLKYGVDEDIADVDDFFTAHRDLAFTLPLPKDTFYSRQEMGKIAREVARTAFLDESTGPVRRRVFRETIAALQDFGTKESYEATSIRVNMIRTGGFYAALEYGVTTAVDRLRNECGDASVRTYLSGGDLELNGLKVENTIKAVAAELRAI
jgi:hypothetical protein